MTIFAGVFAREGVSIPAAMRDEIAENLSRRPGEDIDSFEGQGFYLARVDIGAYGSPGRHVDRSGSLVAFAGDTLLDNEPQSPSRTREADAERLCGSFALSDWSILRDARGVFCGVYFDAVGSKLSLFSDGLGTRPLYYAQCGDYFYFATALRILENLSSLSRTIDLRGTMEISSFQFPLGKRTPYREIRTIGMAETVHVDRAGAVRCETYLNWGRIEPIDGDTETFARRAHALFLEAVALRLGDRKSTAAFLSGGLDSRCVVAALRSLGASVHSFNFAAPGTQDQAFGADLAKAAPTTHHNEPMVDNALGGGFAMLATRAIERAAAAGECERFHLIWGGEGGSIGLGHCDLNERMVALAAAGDYREAAAEFLRYRGKRNLHDWLYTAPVSAEMATVLEDGIVEEILALDRDRSDRIMFNFLLANYQRRHMMQPFEEIDLHRLEFVMPFYDLKFLVYMSKIPIDICLYHKLYMPFMDALPAFVREVPWQAYPDHVPCPLPVPAHLVSQWKAPEDETKVSLRRKRAVRVLKALLAPNFPSRIMRRNVALMAAVSELLGIRNAAHIVRKTDKFLTYWEKTDDYLGQPKVS